MTTSHHPPDNHLSAAERQRTCAACGRLFEACCRTGLEVFLDGEVRYAAVHEGCSTHPAARESTIAGKLSRMRSSEAA